MSPDLATPLNLLAGSQPGAGHPSSMEGVIETGFSDEFAGDNGSNWLGGDAGEVSINGAGGEHF